MSVICRFAPSPTGYLHIGNVRTALINWLFVRKEQGKFILRIDDTDITRSELKYVDQIEQDLKWLGINWDEKFAQSSRKVRYEEAKQKLITSGRLYPCFETAEEIEMKRKILLSTGKPPIYDRQALNLTKEKIAEFIAAGKKPHYRFKLEDKTISWHDLIRGEITFEAKNLSDPILIREDGSMTYMICSAIDDIDYKITHVLRGEDHINNTAIGAQLTEALAGHDINYAHLSLLKTKNDKLSKRVGGFDIKSLREKTIDPMAINSLLATLGSSLPIEPKLKLEELIGNFDFGIYSKAPATYDEEELNRLNHKIISSFSYEVAKNKLQQIGIECDKTFWNGIKNNLTVISDAKEWYDICHTKITPLISEEDKEFLIQASLLLPEEKWDETTWKKWSDEVGNKLNRKGKTLFLPIRKALTGKDHGPELAVLLPLIDRKKVHDRLNGLTQ